MFWSLQVTRDALCRCKKSLFQKNLFARTEQTDELQKCEYTQIIFTYISLSSSKPRFLTARESPGWVFISMNVVWKGSKFQKSPPVSAWFMSSTFSQSLTKNTKFAFLHFSKVFPSLGHLAAVMPVWKVSQLPERESFLLLLNASSAAGWYTSAKNATFKDIQNP